MNENYGTGLTLDECRVLVLTVNQYITASERQIAIPITSGEYTRLQIAYKIGIAKGLLEKLNLMLRQYKNEKPNSQ